MELESAEDPLLAGGFVYEMLLAHEHQHNETMLQLIQMVEGYEPVELEPPAARAGREGPGDGPGRGGEVEIGAGAHGFAYDNERPRHAVELEPFWIDRTPVTNRAYAEFVEETGAEPPMYWEPDGDGGGCAPRWAAASAARPRPAGGPRLLARGRRVRALGRQAAADRAGVGGGRARARTRERANLDQLAFGLRPAGRLRRRAPRDCGAVQMLGDVWEWTALGLHGLPGLRGVPLPRVLGGLLRRRPTRCCAAAPGRPAAT